MQGYPHEWQLPLVNKDLHRTLSDLMDLRADSVEWHHVRGHQGNEGNEAADKLAKMAAL